MEKRELPIKAFAYSRKILPAEINSKFYHVNESKSQQGMSCDKIYKQGNNKKKKIKMFSFSSLAFCVFLFVITFLSVQAFMFPSSGLGKQVSDVVEKLFEPKDLGKIKFTNGTNIESEMEKAAFSSLSGFDMPFVACEAKNIGDVFLLTSAGEITVKCAMDGVVESIETNPVTFKKTITVAHEHGLKSIYSMLDTASVKVGDRVQKNTILGITFTHEIGFLINWNNKVIKGLEIVDGQLSFV